jgi:gamma-glutamylcyclotransferase (GGCT)/AIG2-like uncharacterized protein YtfP
MVNIFSYGTLQQQNVQQALFGRLLSGHKDALKGFGMKTLEIQNEFVVEASSSAIHPIIFFTGKEEHKVNGTLFKVTQAEFLKIDSYEVEAYKRIKVVLSSGVKSWVYVEKDSYK